MPPTIKDNKFYCPMCKKEMDTCHPALNRGKFIYILCEPCDLTFVHVPPEEFVVYSD